eukprot:scaffold613543_cov38-Prasinocladus_malaysianus.AAC.1
MVHAEPIDLIDPVGVHRLAGHPSLDHFLLHRPHQAVERGPALHKEPVASGPTRPRDPVLEVL